MDIPKTREEAQQRGLPLFKPDEPCPNGNIALHWTYGGNCNCEPCTIKNASDRIKAGAEKEGCTEAVLIRRSKGYITGNFQRPKKEGEAKPKPKPKAPKPFKLTTAHRLLLAVAEQQRPMTLTQWFERLKMDMPAISKAAKHLRQQGYLAVQPKPAKPYYPKITDKGKERATALSTEKQRQSEK